MDKKFCMLWVLLMFCVMMSPVVFAQEVEQITEPLNRIYDIVKGVVTIVALLALTYAGGKFMTSGDNPQAREGAKGVVTSAVIGLVLVWIAPLLVSYLTAPVA